MPETTHLLRLTFASVLAASIGVAGMASGQIRPPSPPIDSTAVETGLAVAWPQDLVGRTTATGTAYRPDDWVVAHPTLPLGTRLVLLDDDLETGAVVTVADRAAMLESGSMLVSDAVARLLRVREGDPKRVRFRRMARGTSTPPGPWTTPARPFEEQVEADRVGWSIQLGSFSDRQAAERFAERLDGARAQRVRVGRRTVYRVYFGRFADRQEAEAWKERLAGWGIDGFVKSLDDIEPRRIP